jgi:hypothetical protein
MGDTKKDKIEQIAEIAASLGWCLALPADNISHIILGDKTIVKSVCAQVETEDYELFTKEGLQ